MLEDAQKRRVIESLRAGRYSVLLGAGFSKAAIDRAGAPLPLSQQLADELAETFEKPKGKHPLSRLWQALPQDRAERYLVERFRDCQPQDNLPLLRKFVWNGIYSLNVDDVVEKIYEKEGCAQHLEYFGPRSDYSLRESIQTVQCVHLHGSVLYPEHGFVFSAADYAAATISHSAWWPVLADLLASTPFIIVGCTLDEFDLEHHLARRGTIDAKREPSPSLFVDPFADDVIDALAERHGFEVIRASASEFLGWLYEESKPIPSASDILSASTPSSLFSGAPPARDLRIFQRQFVRVADGELPQPVERGDFLRGATPSWPDIVENKDVLRSDVRRLLSGIEQRGAPGPGRTLVERLEAGPGAGKTAALMRSALELSRLGHPVFFFSGMERLNPRATARVAAQVRGAPILFVDVLSDHVDEVVELVEEVEANDAAVILVGADRSAYGHKIASAVGKLNVHRLRMSRLTSSEASDLVQKLNREGLLGKKARQPLKTLTRKAEGNDLVVALCEVTSERKRFDDIVDAIWEDTREDARELLARVAIAHSNGYPIKVAIAQAGSGLTIGDCFREAASGSLQNVVYRTGQNREYFELSHRVIAERLVERAIPGRQRFRAYCSVANGLAPYVNPATIKARTLEYHLARKLLDYDPTVRRILGSRAAEFYEEIRERWKWNSRYWTQLALMELETGKLDAALAHAEHAVGRERHPLTYTTLARIQMAIAERAGSRRSGERQLRDAIENLKEAIRRRPLRPGGDEHSHHVAVSGATRFYRRWDVPVPSDIDEWVSSVLDDTKHFRGKMDWARLRSDWNNLRR